MQAGGFLKYCWPKVIYCICIGPMSTKWTWTLYWEKLGGPNRGPSNNLVGPWPPRPLFRIATVNSRLRNVKSSHFKQRRTQGGWGWTPPWAWHFTKTLLPSQRRSIVFVHFFLVNFST